MENVIENVIENVQVIEKKERKRKQILTTNAERLRKYKILNREKYLQDCNKQNMWKKYKFIYLNILLD
jgi:hypothetical protein